MPLRGIHQGTSRVATRKLSSGAEQPTITLRALLDGTDDGGGISESSSQRLRVPGARAPWALKELPWGDSQAASDEAKQPSTSAPDQPGVAMATP
jgi:hypothetical protein